MQNETQFGHLAMIINIDRFTKSCINSFGKQYKLHFVTKRKKRKKRKG